MHVREFETNSLDCFRISSGENVTIRMPAEQLRDIVLFALIGEFSDHLTQEIDHYVREFETNSLDCFRISSGENVTIRMPAEQLRDIVLFALIGEFSDHL